MWEVFDCTTGRTACFVRFGFVANMLSRLLSRRHGCMFDYDRRAVNGR